MIIDIAVTLFCVLLVYLADTFGDSEKPTAWMFFLGPIGLYGLAGFWLSRLVFIFI
jgi:hypothetical protein